MGGACASTQSKKLRNEPSGGQPAGAEGTKRKLRNRLGVGCSIDVNGQLAPLPCLCKTLGIEAPWTRDPKSVYLLFIFKHHCPPGAIARMRSKARPQPGSGDWGQVSRVRR